MPDRAPKVAKWPQRAKYQKVRKQKILQKESYLSLNAKPQQLFQPHPNPKHSPIDPKKDENDKKSKLWKQKKIENESYHFTVVNPKKNSHIPSWH